VRRWIPQSILVSFVAIGAGSLIGFPVTSPPPITVRPPHGRPDVILITVDALRADHLSLYGYRKLTSPILDEFAGHAAVFTSAITQAPYTKAAIASLMTGLYPTSHQAVTTTIPFPETMTGHVSTKPMATDVGRATGRSGTRPIRFSSQRSASIRDSITISSFLAATSRRRRR
jgi:hypothetical protein